MTRTFWVAKNPDAGSTLPFVIDVPLPGGSVILKAKEPWPRTAKVYCHRVEEWPEEAEIVEEVAVRSCVRRGVAVDLVLDRARENRSQFVFTTLRNGRDGIFWQSARTTRKTRPGLRMPTRRSAAGALAIIVDTRERYPWKFSDQQVDVSKRALAVELTETSSRPSNARPWPISRRASSTAACSSCSVSLRRYPGAAVVVEDRWADVFRLQHVSPSMVAEMLAGAQVRYPIVPIVFCETRALAPEWAYRFLGAALAFADEAPALSPDDGQGEPGSTVAQTP